jgi:nitrile hydratase accessory protein
VTLPVLDDLPLLPRDADGPVFREPWEASAFALAVSLHARGVFTWPHWAAALAEELARARDAGRPDPGGNYYGHWLAALERLVAEASLVTPGDLRARAIAIETARRHDHDHDHDHGHGHDHDHDHEPDEGECRDRGADRA